jgi:SAM-dependent methyltransferase
LIPFASGALPNPIYRREFFETVMGESPDSLLDIGCGDGAFLKAAIAHGCRAHGLDTDESAIMRLRDEGLPVELGRAEALPFADASFDLVTFSYTTHHLAELSRAIEEAWRVAREGVLILEGWYDSAVPSQRVAETYDLWSKTIDRRLGMVHNPLPTAAGIFALCSPMADLGRFDYAQRLILAPWPFGDVRRNADAQLTALGQSDPKLMSELERILSDAARDGISRDGALMIRIARR